MEGMASSDGQVVAHDMTSSVPRDKIIVLPYNMHKEEISVVQGHVTDINQQIVELKKEQEIQKQMLWHTFQEKTKQLELQHKIQLEHKYQFAAHSNGVFQELREQRSVVNMAEHKEKREYDVFKRKDNCSANASPEVKQILMSFLRNKKAANSSDMGTSSALRNRSVVKSSSGESLPAGSVTTLHPYKMPQATSSICKHELDFPLRKTASEPNLLKIRLKQSVIERKARTNPLAARRHERLLPATQRRHSKHSSILSIETSSNAADSGSSSPPVITGSRGSPTNSPIQEENEDPHYMDARGSINDLSLFSSPSLPNISLGKPHLASAQCSATHLPKFSICRQPSGIPLLSAGPHDTCPPFASINQGLSKPINTATDQPPQAHASNSLQHCHLLLNQIPAYGQPITDAQVAHARLNKQGHRPLGRTQSAPLPLGHPMLSGTLTMNVIPRRYENSDVKLNMYAPQKIRQTVLTKNHRESQFREEETDEVIDLTDKKKPPTTLSMASTIAERLASDSAHGWSSDQKYLQHQREILMKQPLQVQQPLSRTFSSPLVYLVSHMTNRSTCQQNDQMPPVNLSVSQRFNGDSAARLYLTGLAFDNIMLKHACTCGNNSLHPEHSGRLQSVWARLIETGLASRCERLRSRKATQEELQTVHTEAHALLFGSNQLSRRRQNASFVRLACGGVGVDLDTTWNEQYTANAAIMAVGCVVDLAFKIAKNDIKNGFAIVRPPGHHAEANLAMGFCFFNSVAIAAKLLLKNLSQIRKILIVDWDVHHGNGTQQAFYDSSEVLYLSIHRHDNGNFFPGTGGSTECGSGSGLGFNVNISWSGNLNPPLGDAEYLAAFRTIVMPIAREFSPDIVLVSAGFDAAVGHSAPLGGYIVSPACFGHMTRELMQLASGRVVLALEGGYDLAAVCDSAEECVRALLGDEPTPIMEEELSRRPCQNAIHTLQRTLVVQMPHWPCIRNLAHTVGMSMIQAMNTEREQESDTVTAMAGLSMKPVDINNLPLENYIEPMEQDEVKQ